MLLTIHRLRASSQAAEFKRSFVIFAIFAIYLARYTATAAQTKETLAERHALKLSLDV